MGVCVRRVVGIVVGIVALIAGLGLLPGQPVRAAVNTYIVNASGDAGTGTGLSGDIRYAVTQANANPGSTITFDTTGTGPTITLTHGTLTVGANVTIMGPGAGTLAVAVINVASGASLTLRGLTIANSGDLSDPAVTNNGTLIADRMAFNGNTTSVSGVSSMGGALLNQLGATLTVTKCTFTQNIGANAGGAIFDNQGTLTVVNSTFSGNTGYGNGGGAIFAFGDTATITNSTITANNTFTDGGGIFSIGGTVTLTNTIVAGNVNNYSGITPNDIISTVPVAGSNNLIGTGGSGGLVNGTNGNQVGVANPGLGTLGSYGGPTQTTPLLPGSPAIDAGAPVGGSVPANDQRGKGRVGATTDIGAFESQGFALTKQHDNQSTAVTATFASPLAVTVAPNNAGEPVDGGQTTFTIQPGTGGASATFGTAAGCSVSGGNLVAVCTIGSGAATTPTLTANTTPGGFTVTAAATGAATQTFHLTNVGPATHFTVSAPASATAGMAFANLVVTALDTNNNTVTGYTGTVQFTSTDPQATLPVNSPLTNGTRIFSVTLKTAGNQTISAQDGALSGTSNTIAVAAAAPASIAADPATTPQSTQVGHPFAAQLKAVVKDAFGNATNNLSVTFTAPGSGASGTFAGGVTTATTDASGVATAAVFTANGTAGGYSVTANLTTGPLGTPASFALTNTVGPPGTIVAVAGGGQSAVGNTAFAANLQAKVTDASGNPIGGVTVTFTAPSSGASGTFAGTGTTTATATTNASGIATAPVFTANTTVGGYTVAASASGVATPATFALTNTHGAVTQVTIGGVPGGGTPIKVGQTLQLTATATYADGTTQDVTSQVTWTSSDTNVATVGVHTGLVTIVGPGTVTITATWTTSGAAGSPATVTGTTQLTVSGGTAVGVAPVPAPASRPGSAGTTPPVGSPAPTPNPVPTGR
jgi:hypothetical protein